MQFLLVYCWMEIREHLVRLGRRDLVDLSDQTEVEAGLLRVLAQGRERFGVTSHDSSAFWPFL
jgi:hypothetical protein